MSGYLHKPGEVEQEAGHAWVEAYIPDLGWVSFDPTNAVSATEHYVAWPSASIILMRPRFEEAITESPVKRSTFV